jgi:hypothetical protein
MSMSYYNATLEYATNTLKFWLYDENGVEVNFDVPLTLGMARIDGTGSTQTITGSVSGNHATFIVTPSEEMLYKAGDSLYDYEAPKYEHAFSIKSEAQVFIVGKLNLVQAP